MGVRLKLFIFSAVSLVGFQNALAQEERSWDEIEETFERGCGDDDGTDRCDPEVQQRMRELYELQPAEDLVAQDVSVRRAMIIDGYGNDVVAISFLRAPGQSPFIDVRIPLQSDESDRQSLVARIDGQSWEEAVQATSDFDRTFTDEYDSSVSSEDGPITICLHGWFVVVEAVDAARMDQAVLAQQARETAIRRDAEGSCVRGAAVPAAFELARLAYENLPECSSLDLEMWRNIPQLLARCNALGGDRIAAGEAYELVWQLERVRDGIAESEAYEFMAFSARDLWSSFVAAVEGGQIYLDMPNAADVDHAHVSGRVVFWGGEEAQDQAADIEIELVREAGKFRILSYDVSRRRDLE